MTDLTATAPAGDRTRVRPVSKRSIPRWRYGVTTGDCPYPSERPGIEADTDTDTDTRAHP